MFTGSYPYSATAENGFMPQELSVLHKHFDRIIVVPAVKRGTRAVLELPKLVVNTDYSGFRGSTWRRAAYALSSLGDAGFLAEVLRNAAMMLRSPVALLRALQQHVIAKMTQRWIASLKDVQWADTVLYTWWFDATSLGLARFGTERGVPVVTRAHGADLYEERRSPPYFPFRDASLAAVRRVFSVSRAGADYLTRRHARHQDKVRVSLLGVDDPGFSNKPSADGTFRILSCSVLLPVKRVELILRSVAALGRCEPERHFQWTHIGDGGEKEKRALASMARSEMPINVQYELREYPGREGLCAHYRTQPVDLFMNLSASEGTSVAIMEAISVGIPVVATAVGGNVEIVGPDNGLVVSPNPEPSMVAHAIKTLIDDPATLARLRAGSRDKWRTHYSAPNNYAAFAREIREL